MNILALTSEEKLFAHFDQGVIALLDSVDGAVLKVRQMPAQFDSWKVSDQTAVYFDGTNIYTSVYLTTTSGGTTYRENLSSFDMDLNILQDF